MVHGISDLYSKEPINPTIASPFQYIQPTPMSPGLEASQSESRLHRNGQKKVEIIHMITSLPGKSMKVTIPSDEVIRQIHPDLDTESLNSVKALLNIWVPPDGSTDGNWMNYGIVEQQQAARLNSEFLTLIKQPITANLSDLVSRSIERMGRMLEYLEPKSSLDRLLGKDKTEAALYSACLRELESFVQKSEELFPEVDAYLLDLDRFSRRTDASAKIIQTYVEAGRVLEATLQDQKALDAMIDRLQSLAKTAVNLFQLGITQQASVTSARNLKSVVMDYMLTGLPGWMAVASVQHIQDEANRVVARNNLQSLFANIKQGA